MFARRPCRMGAAAARSRSQASRVKGRASRRVGGEAAFEQVGAHPAPALHVDLAPILETEPIAQGPVRRLRDLDPAGHAAGPIRLAVLTVSPQRS